MPSILRHPFYGWVGIRPALAQHTAAEHEAIRKWAAGRLSLVEIGVAEGVSAMAIGAAMDQNGRLYLIDPFHLSRVPVLNFIKRIAHKAVESSARGTVHWIEQFSADAARNWKTAIDFLLIDGDHSEAAVLKDWELWSPFVVESGVVLFHDARIFNGGWTTVEYGPVKLIDHLFRGSSNKDWEIAEEIHSLVVVQRRKKSSRPAQVGERLP